jgi:catechol 2,3-dioxygenase-like lactoylglutathione lyase family enzyme
MHYSRLDNIVIDVPENAHDAELAFWRAALGLPLDQIKRFPEFHGGKLPDCRHGLLVQHLGDGAAKVHLDIHTNDRAAEVARLLRLGATLLDDGEHWAVLRDPAGLVFCVIPDASVNETNARTWTE